MELFTDKGTRLPAERSRANVTKIMRRNSVVVVVHVLALSPFNDFLSCFNKTQLRFWELWKLWEPCCLQQFVFIAGKTIRRGVVINFFICTDGLLDHFF